MPSRSAVDGVDSVTSRGKTTVRRARPPPALNARQLDRARLQAADGHLRREARQLGELTLHRAFTDECPAPADAIDLAFADELVQSAPHRDEAAPVKLSEFALRREAIPRFPPPAVDFPAQSAVYLVVKGHGASDEGGAGRVRGRVRADARIGFTHVGIGFGQMPIGFGVRHAGVDRLLRHSVTSQVFHDSL